MGQAANRLRAGGLSVGNVVQHKGRYVTRSRYLLGCAHPTCGRNQPFVTRLNGRSAQEADIPRQSTERVKATHCCPSG